MSSYRDSYEQPSFWQFLQQLLSAYLRLGTVYGVEIRLCYSAVFFFTLLSYISANELAQITQWPSLYTVIWTIAIPIALLITIFLHEMGHIIAGWRYQITTPYMSLSPLGGTAHMGAAAPHPGAEAFIALAGPATHILILAIFYPLSLYNWDWQMPIILPLLIDTVVSINIALLLFNLLPFYPLDGGHVLKAILTRFLSQERATIIACNVGIAGAIALIIAALIYSGWGTGIIPGIAISNMFACHQKKQSLQYAQEEQAREQWQQDSEWWKQPNSTKTTSAKQAAPHQKQTGLLKRTMIAHREKREQRKQQRDQQSAAAVDEILEKISQHGIDSLSKEEKATLDRASKELTERA